MKTITIFRYVLIAVLTAAAVFCALKYRSISNEGMDRQEIEESIAITYIQDLKNGNPEATVEYEDVTTESVVTESYATPRTEREFDDVNYPYFNGRHYTPDYATGEIMGVLEVPSIQLRRGIYTGTWEDIVHDLDAWMTVQARPDYVLGETHFAIYGHNSVTQDLSFNRLRYVQIGEYFTITSGDKVYYYEATDFFADWRECVTAYYVDNFNLPSDKCYLITCGRDEYRWRDIVLVGTLQKVYDLDEWDAGEMHFYDVVKTEHTTVGIRNEKAEAKLDITSGNGTIRVTVRDKNDTPLEGITVGFYDFDGMVLHDEEGSDMRFTTDENGQIRASAGAPEFVIGIESDTYYSTDYSVKTTTKTIKTEAAGEELYIEDIPIYYIYAGIGAVWLVLCAVVILVTRKPKEKNS